MPEDSFSLVDEPWILALRPSGQEVELSLHDAFTEAPNLADLTGEVPTQVFATMRLLLAIMHAALGPDPETTTEEWLRDWREMWDDWDGVTGAVLRYLDEWRDRFDLFHAERPFFQVVGLRTAKDEVSDLSKLIFDVPNGEPFMTQRVGAGMTSISPGEAARWLVHVQAFDASGIRSGAVGDPRVKGGKGYPIGVAWAGQLGGIVAEGRTLRETLLLNLISFQAAGVAHPVQDRPTWEHDQPYTCKSSEPIPRGPIALYTWQARRVRLVGDSAAITGVVLAQGDRVLPQNRFRQEPFSAWRYSEPQTKKAKGEITYMPREHSASQAFWRGLASVLPLSPTTASARAGKVPPPRAPGVVLWLNAVASAHPDLVRDLRLRALGAIYGSNNAVVDELIDDTVTLEWDVLGGLDDLWRVAIADAIRATEDSVKALRDLAANLSVAAGASSRDTDGPREQVSEIAYARVDEPFRLWLSQLTSHPSPDDARYDWHRQLRALLGAIADDLVRDAGPKAWTGRDTSGIGRGGTPTRIDAALADLWFRNALLRHLPLAMPIAEGAHT